MTYHDPLTFVVLHPSGLRVRGIHNLQSPAVPADLSADFAKRHAKWLDVVLARPGGFDGSRAVLSSFHYAAGTLTLKTNYRSYTEGLALRDSLRHAREQGTLVLPSSGAMPLHAPLSWGMSLTCYFLLPQGYVLCAERDAKLLNLAGLWTCSHTEIMEPEDIDANNMQPLFERLVSEELPSLAGMGTQKFVGLSVRNKSYGWQLVSLIDLRTTPLDDVIRALLLLEPDAETAAWSVYPLEPTTAPNPYPAHMHRATSTLPVDFDIPQFLNRTVPPC